MLDKFKCMLWPHRLSPLDPALGAGSPFKAWSWSVYTAMHATLTARDFFLANFYLSCPFTCIFCKASPKFFLC